MYMRCSCQDDEVLITDYCDSCHANTVEIENGVNMWATSHMWFLIKSDSVGIVVANGAIKLCGSKSRVLRCNDERNEF